MTWMLRRLARWLGLVGFGVLAPALAAHAFYVESRTPPGAGEAVVVRYDTATPLLFRVGAAGIAGTDGDDSEFDAIAAAFATWDAVECSGLSFMQGDRVPAESLDPSHWMTDDTRYILIYWTDDPGLWATPQVGRFAFTYNELGVLIGATIQLNSLHHQWSTAPEGEAGKLDVQGTVTALIGRSLGITSTLEGNATYPRYSENDISKRTLGADDIAGITYLYSTGGSCMTMEPEAICADMTPDCPPTPTLPDGGVIPEADGGNPVPRDSGPAPRDSGTSEAGGDDDCSCRAPGAVGSSGIGRVGAGLVLAGLLAVRRRRRRRRAPR